MPGSTVEPALLALVLACRERRRGADVEPIFGGKAKIFGGDTQRPLKRRAFHIRMHVLKCKKHLSIEPPDPRRMRKLQFQQAGQFFITHPREPAVHHT